MQRRPVALVVASTLLYERCAEAAGGGLLGVRPCGISTIATEAARWRPVAIVVTRDVHAFDAAEFDALARDVGARLVIVADEGISAEDLRSALVYAARLPAPPRDVG